MDGRLPGHAADHAAPGRDHPFGAGRREKGVAMNRTIPREAPEKPGPAIPGPEQVAAIPRALRDIPRWVVWRRAWIPPTKRKPGYWSKPPVNPATGLPTNATDEAAWMPFAEALALALAGNYDGIGFALGKPGDGPIVAID